MTTKKNNDVAEIEAYMAMMESKTAPAWMPDANESLFGEVIDLRMGSGDHGPYPIIVIRADYGVRSVHAFHTLLRDGFKEIGVRKGMRVGITYKGLTLKNSAKDIPEEKREKTDFYHMFFVVDMDKLSKPEEDVPFEL